MEYKWDGITVFAERIIIYWVMLMYTMRKYCLLSLSLILRLFTFDI